MRRGVPSPTAFSPFSPRQTKGLNRAKGVGMRIYIEAADDIDQMARAQRRPASP
jgi:hypothetical protein